MSLRAASYSQKGNLFMWDLEGLIIFILAWTVLLDYSLNLLNNIVCYLKLGLLDLGKERDYRKHNQNEFSLRCASFPTIITSNTSSYQWFTSASLEKIAMQKVSKRYCVQMKNQLPKPSLLSWLRENVGDWAGTHTLSWLDLVPVIKGSSWGKSNHF